MRLVPVRLCDLEPAVLAAAARRCARKENGDQGAILDLLHAAAAPSARTYWLPADCADMVRMLTRRA